VISVIVGLCGGVVFEVLSLLGWFVGLRRGQWLAPEVAPHIPVGKRVRHQPCSGIPACCLRFGGVGFGSRLPALLIHATAAQHARPLVGRGVRLVAAAGAVAGGATVVSLTLMKSPAWQVSKGAQWLQSHWPACARCSQLHITASAELASGALNLPRICMCGIVGVISKSRSTS